MHENAKKVSSFFKYQDVGKQDKYAHKSLPFFYSSADCKSKLQLAPWLAAFGTQMQADAPGWGRLTDGICSCPVG